MATLTSEQLGWLRKKAMKLIGTANHPKSVYNAALQALEDWYEDERATVNGLINAATSPATLTATEKKLLAAYFLFQKYEREKE